MFTGTKLAAVLGAAALGAGLAAPAVAYAAPEARAATSQCWTHSAVYQSAAKMYYHECRLWSGGKEYSSATVQVSDIKTDGKCARAEAWVVGHKSSSLVKVSDCSKDGRYSAAKRTGWWTGKDARELVWAS